jgi:hypothetical protein
LSCLRVLYRAGPIGLAIVLALRAFWNEGPMPADLAGELAKGWEGKHQISRIPLVI